MTGITLTDRSVTVLCLHLDTGRLYLTDAAGWGTALGDVVQAIIEVGTVTLDEASVRVRAAALSGQWLSSRRAVLWRCLPGSLPETGQRLFDGICQGQPDEQDGILSLSLCLPLYDEAAAQVPPYGTITAAEWPQAAEGIAGKTKPMIWGTVERCPLLPVQTGLQTKLRSAAYPGDDSLAVDDCAGWPESGMIAVDGTVYSYSAHDDTTVYGLTVSRLHAAETVAYQPVEWVYLAAGHPVQSITAIRAGEAAVTGARVNLSAATVSFPAPPYREKIGELSTYYANFDLVTPRSTAFEGVNAIQAATGPAQTQQAGNVPLSLTGATAKDTPVQFARPLAQGGSDTIIGAAYEVRITVASPVDCQVSVGGKTAYVQTGGAVLYHPALLTWLSEDNTDQIAVAVTVAEGADASAVAVTVQSATRTVIVGNADSARYAVLRAPANRLLSVTQLDQMPPRGVISRAQVAIEWAASDALQSGDSITVRWDGRALGTLRRDRRGQTTQALSFNFDLSQTGRARLQTQDLRTVVSGGTTTLTNKPTADAVPVMLSYGSIAPSAGFTIYSGEAVINVPPNVMVGGTVSGMLDFARGGTVTAPVYIETSDGQSYTIGGGSPGARRTFGAEIRASTQWIRISHGEFYTTEDYNQACRVVGVNISWPINILQENNTPASGSTTVENTALPLSGTLAASNTLTSPGDEQTIISWFDLPEREWGEFTNKTLEIELISSRTALSVLIVRALITIEHAPVSREPADPGDLTATVTGLSGQPVEVIAGLADRAGVALSPLPLRRLSAALVGWSLSRRLDDTAEARGLLYDLCDHLCLDRIDTAEGLAILTPQDLAGWPVQILHPAEMVSSPAVTWTSIDSRVTDLTYRYRPIDGDTTRVITATPAASPVAALARLHAGKTIPREVESDWVADDATAQAVVAATLRRDGPMQRSLSVTLPPRWASVPPGTALSWAGSLWRLRVVSRSGAGVEIKATEIPRFQREL